MSEPLQLNLTEIVKARAGKKGKWIPSFLLHGLERIIRQKELNEMLRIAHPAEGSAFSRKILSHLGIECVTTPLPPGVSTPLPQGGGAGGGVGYIFASNHPLGGLDGVALVAVLGEAYGDENIRVMVNDLLMNVTPLAGVFLPINKYGSSGTRESSRLLTEALEAGKHIVMFPSGLVSRINGWQTPLPQGGGAGGGVADREWKKTFVSKALEYGRQIVPVHFEAQNSMRFYRTAQWRERLGIKVNLEQALLPGEICKSRGKRFEIRFGEPVDPAALAAEGLSPRDIAAAIYRRSYSL